MKKVIVSGLAAAAVGVGIAVAGPPHADQDNICGPGGCFDHLGSGICDLIRRVSARASARWELWASSWRSSPYRLPYSSGSYSSACCVRCEK
jgi:hypothetical protein